MPGISLHTELELLVRLGLSSREALAAATNHYALQFGWNELGLVTPGRRADIAILDLGAGTSTNVLDFFLVSDHGILVLVPELAWGDITATGTPTLWRLASEGAVGDLSAALRAFFAQVPEARDWVVEGTAEPE